MKYLLITLILSFTFYGISRHFNSDNDLLLDEVSDMECSLYYEFGDSIIDLYNLKTVNHKKEDIQLFKECGNHKYRFMGDRYGITLKRDSILNDIFCTYTFIDPSKVKVKDPDFEVNYYDLPHELLVGGKEIRPYNFSHPSGIILIYEFPDSLHYHIYRMKYNGELTGHLRIRHSDVKMIQPNSAYFSRYLFPVDYRENYLVLSGNHFSDETKKTVVVNLIDMTSKEYDFNISAVIWDDFENGIKGFIIAPEKREYSEKSILKMLWLSDSTYLDLEIPYASEKCQTLLWGSQLFVANYHPISTGSSLHCFDIYTKKKLWEADVLQLNVDHSKYYNKVTISKYRDRIIMEGNEAYGNYLQIFEMHSGKRLAEFGDVVTKK